MPSGVGHLHAVAAWLANGRHLWWSGLETDDAFGMAPHLIEEGVMTVASLLKANE